MKTIPGKFKRAVLGAYVLFAAMLTMQACEVTEAEFAPPDVFDIEVYQRLLGDTFESAAYYYATEGMLLQDAMQLSLQKHLGTDAYNEEFLSVLEQYRSNRNEHSDNSELKARNRFEQSSASEQQALFEETLSGVTTVSEAIDRLEEMRSEVDIDENLEFSTVSLIELLRFYGRLNTVDLTQKGVFGGQNVAFASFQKSPGFYFTNDQDDPYCNEDHADFQNPGPEGGIPCGQEYSILNCLLIAFGAAALMSIPGCKSLVSTGFLIYGPKGAATACIAGALARATAAGFITYGLCTT